MGGKPVFYKIISMIAVICGVIVFPGTKNVVAQSNDLPAWDFSGKQQPRYDLLWSYEERIAGYSCPVQIKKIHDNYVRLHPEFRPHVNDETMLKEFRRILIMNASKGEKFMNDCYVDMLVERKRKYERENRANTDPLVRFYHYLLEAIGLKRRSRILYCGVVAINLDKHELPMAQTLEEYTEYAFQAYQSANFGILFFDGNTKFLKLNPDIRYYLQLQLEKISVKTSEVKQLHAPLLRPVSGLTPQRRIFVDKAFALGDYSSVLETTDPC